MEVNGQPHTLETLPPWKVLGSQSRLGHCGKDKKSAPQNKQMYFPF
jgi:hypothetical protein